MEGASPNLERRQERRSRASKEAAMDTSCSIDPTDASFKHECALCINSLHLKRNLTREGRVRQRWKQRCGGRRDRGSKKHGARCNTTHKIWTGPVLVSEMLPGREPWLLVSMHESIRKKRSDNCTLTVNAVFLFKKKRTHFKRHNKNIQLFADSSCFSC